MPSCGHCHAVTVTQSLSHSHCHVVAVTRLLSCSRCHAVTVMQSLSCSHCHAVTVTTVSGGHCHDSDTIGHVIMGKTWILSSYFKKVVLRGSCQVVTVMRSLSGSHCQAVTVRWLLSGGHCQVVTVRRSLSGGHCHNSVRGSLSQQ